MAAPQVQTLAQVMADLNPAFQGQEANIAKQKVTVGQTYDAQRSAITAEKGQGFNDINDSARGRGVGAAFSGIPVDEQARYLSTKFLPGMQAADANQNKDSLALDMQSAQLATQKQTQALGRIDQQQSALNAWNLQQEQLAATARENALNRAAEAAQAAASRAATQSAQPSANAQVRAYLDQYVDPKTGKVPVAIWQNAVRRASESGLGFSGNNGFASTFWNYADDSNWKAYKNGYEQWN